MELYYSNFLDVLDYCVPFAHLVICEILVVSNPINNFDQIRKET